MSLIDRLKGKFLGESPTEDVEETGPEVMDCSSAELGDKIEVNDDYDENCDPEEELNKLDEIAARGRA